MKYFLLLALAMLLLGCASQSAEQVNELKNQTANQTKTEEVVTLIAEKGDLVAVDYLGTLDNGAVFDTSIKEEAAKANLPLRPAYSPLEFTVGAGQMIAGFDSAVLGMKIGDEKTVTLKPSEAYGEKREDLIVSVPKNNTPEGIQVGSKLMTSSGMAGVVVALDNETIKIDFNHELAGQALTFKIIMRKITKAGS
ncbi:MAG: peptidylprolyl isomerase [Candidatus Micrarchaeota archaeon]